MLIRMLLVLLMVVGPMPVQICNCAVASQPTANVVDTPLDHQIEASHCECRAKSPSSVAETVLFSQSCDAAAMLETSGDHSHPLQHSPDCPAVNPVPVATPAISNVTFKLTFVVDLGLHLWGQLLPIQVRRVRTLQAVSSPVRSIPLYLAQLTLQI